MAGWFVEPLPRRGYARRPHYYLAGASHSLCDVSARARNMLPFDPTTMLTTVNDPRLGAPQIRRACQLCALELRGVTSTDATQDNRKGTPYEDQHHDRTRGR